MTEFKVGDYCVDTNRPSSGKLLIRNAIDLEYPLRVFYKDGSSNTFDKGGLEHSLDEIPRFITIEEAIKRSLIPPEPIVVEFESEITIFMRPSFGEPITSGSLVFSDDLNKHIGKKCKVRVEIL